MHILKT